MLRRRRITRILDALLVWLVGPGLSEEEWDRRVGCALAQWRQETR